MRASKLLTRLGASIICAASLANAASYTIVDTYDKSNFFTDFNFFSSTDPTHGFVTYSSAITANSSGLAGYVDGGVFLGVDHTSTNPTGGRGSTRVTSNKAYTHGLFIADIAHMPGSICGVWPSLWTFGGNWPTQGEIDIIEGVNDATTNTVTLHTSSGCTMTSTGSLPTSNLTGTNCNAGNGNDGCGFQTTSTTGYGTGFNAQGGGVYAMEWTSSSIKVWNFARTAIPANIASGSPDPTTWGTPTSAFGSGSNGGCNIDQHFTQHNIVFDTTFCGDWAGNVWTESATCSKLAPTCAGYVAANPSAFAEAYWLINSVKVYQAPTTAAGKRGVSFMA
ncbi:related to mixed-linked glucanase precursor MLG1 [Phialocephala subalpina]|uniref:endo-1,3(4)-beta-glucanase n=1 Tax=Phialocephala subalpina TaxID=576137 RepID=A0A1L7WMC4_9HELO|nr:related to mixed-linked glucanase precursor MLG1 [Phialocephala subalpina]